MISGVLAIVLGTILIGYFTRQTRKDSFMGKEEAVLAFDQKLVEAKGELYDAGFADGAASIPPGPTVDMGLPADEEAVAMAAAVEPLKAEIADLHVQMDAVMAAKADVEGKLVVDEAMIGKLKGSLEKLKELVGQLESMG